MVEMNSSSVPLKTKREVTNMAMERYANGITYTNHRRLVMKEIIARLYNLLYDDDMFTVTVTSSGKWYSTKAYSLTFNDQNKFQYLNYLCYTNTPVRVVYDFVSVHDVFPSTFWESNDKNITHLSTWMRDETSAPLLAYIINYYKSDTYPISLLNTRMYHMKDGVRYEVRIDDSMMKKFKKAVEFFILKRGSS